MQITLETIRSITREAFGRDSFIASLITTVEPDPTHPTACINGKGELRYNPDFVKQYVTTQEDLFCLVTHELMHPLFGHFVHGTGFLENLAGDMVINSVISQLLAGPSGQGSLFRKLYPSTGVEALLRPYSNMRLSRYDKLYDAFYFNLGSRRRDSLTTGEAVQALKILTPAQDVPCILFLGTHGTGKEQQNSKASSIAGRGDDLARIAEDFKHAVDRCRDPHAGYGEGLYDMFIEVLKTHLTLKKALLQRFLTHEKLDRFIGPAQRPRSSVSPIPIQPSKRDFVLLAAGIPPFHYHNHAYRAAVQKKGLAVYLDVSGSVNDYLPEIVGLLHSLRDELKTVFLFSNQVVEVPFKTLLAGKVQTTHGTDFDCIADSIIERGFSKAVILTDGYACLAEDKQAELKKRKLRTLTILFGGTTDCDEFAPFGDVLQLEDVTG